MNNEKDFVSTWVVVGAALALWLFGVASMRDPSPITEPVPAGVDTVFVAVPPPPIRLLGEYGMHCAWIPKEWGPEEDPPGAP